MCARRKAGLLCHTQWRTESRLAAAPGQRRSLALIPLQRAEEMRLFHSRHAFEDGPQPRHRPRVVDKVVLHLKDGSVRTGGQLLQTLLLVHRARNSQIKESNSSQDLGMFHGIVSLGYETGIVDLFQL